MFLEKLNRPGLLSGKILKILKNGHHSWIGHIIRHNAFVVTIFERAIS
jgi:hypothetical protein